MPKIRAEHGQALVEFMMLMPVVLTFLWYLVHVSFAINKSIVGQKHARSQLFHKMFNHRSGPVTSDYITSPRSHYYIGVAGGADNYQSGSRPKAPVETLGIGSAPSKMTMANDEPGEPAPNTLRQNVRVRTVFGICTHRRKQEEDGVLSDFCGTRSNGGQ